MRGDVCQQFKTLSCANDMRRAMPHIVSDSFERMEARGARFPAERCVQRGVRLLQESGEMMARVRFGEGRACDFVVFK